MTLKSKNGQSVGSSHFGMYVGRYVAGMAQKIVHEHPGFNWGKAKWQSIPISQVRAIRSKYSKLKGDAEISSFISEHCKSLHMHPRSMQKLLLGFSRPYIFSKYGLEKQTAPEFPEGPSGKATSTSNGMAE